MRKTTRPEAPPQIRGARPACETCNLLHRNAVARAKAAAILVQVAPTPEAYRDCLADAYRAKLEESARYCDMVQCTAGRCPGAPPEAPPEAAPRAPRPAAGKRRRACKACRDMLATATDAVSATIGQEALAPGVQETRFAYIRILADYRRCQSGNCQRGAVIICVREFLAAADDQDDSVPF